MELAGKRVYLAGHAGMVGSAVHRRLASEDCEVLTTTRSDVDLRNQAAVQAWMADVKPDAVIVAAAKVGGILANDTQPADFLYDNLMIEANLIHAAYEAKVEKLLFLGSSCIYPKLAEQPMREDALLTGPLEPTNEWYAIAKIAGIKMCQAYRKQHGCDFISAMPTNMYGFNDNFDLQSSHVLPALMVKVHNAKLNGDKSYEVWGSGAPLREFMYADDCADALVHLLQHYSGESHVNVGTGEEVSVRQLAETMCEVIGFDGDLVFDASKPDGTPRKLMDSSLLRGMGWSPKVQLKQGIARTYQWYLDNADQLRG